MFARVGLSTMARMAVRPATTMSALARTQVCCMSAAADKSVSGTVKAFDARRVSSSSSTSGGAAGEDLSYGRKKRFGKLIDDMI